MDNFSAFTGPPPTESFREASFWPFPRAETRPVSPKRPALVIDEDFKGAAEPAYQFMPGDYTGLNVNVVTNSFGYKFYEDMGLEAGPKLILGKGSTNDPAILYKNGVRSMFVREDAAEEQLKAIKDHIEEITSDQGSKGATAKLSDLLERRDFVRQHVLERRLPQQSANFVGPLAPNVH
jgi:hypothetical protein